MERSRFEAASSTRLAGVVIGGLLLVAGCGEPVRTERGSAPPPDEASAPAAPTREQAEVSSPAGPVSGAEPDPCGAVPVMTRYRLFAPGGRPGGVAAGDDGSVWFTDSGTGSIGRLEAGGAVTRYPLPPGSHPGAIARGPDGNFWFTEMKMNDPPAPVASSGYAPSSTAGHDDDGALHIQVDASALEPTPSIGRITPDGAISHFALPPTKQSGLVGVMGNGLGSITAGPDGAMWFTETGADQIGRIAADGTITEFPLPERHRMHTNPEGIASGPDGAVWFSQPLRESIGRIDVSTHAITERYLPPPRGGTVRGNSLASGPGDALWFDDARHQGVGRMSLDGTVDTLSLPARGDYWPGSVTAGPDGNIWFLDSRGRRVMRITPEGSVTEFPPLEGIEGHGSQMAAASDGVLWFSVPASNEIGRITCRSG